MTGNILIPPRSVQGMKTLDKKKFEKEITVPVVYINADFIQIVTAALKIHLLKIDNFKPVQETKDDTNKKVIYLTPDFKGYYTLSSADKKLLGRAHVGHSDFKYEKVCLNYDNWSAHTIINAVLPEENRFSGFSIIGRIFHLNLKNELLPYKEVIAEVLLDKFKNCNTVVNKNKTISNEFRNFEMEVLAGDKNLKVIVKENNVQFELDLGKVYWNPRLCTEHERIINKLTEKDILYDVFCGIGPFAIPAAKKGCTVLANDLNPDCISYLTSNIKLNKVNPDRVRIFNKDGKNFIKEDIRKHMLEYVPRPGTKIHVTMNLPQIAVEFLSNFQDLFEPFELSHFPDGSLPIVHVYCFVKGEEDPKSAAKNRVLQFLNVDIRNLESEYVRNVAPNKEMIRVTFQLTKSVLEKNSERKRHLEENGGSEIKKPRYDDSEKEDSDDSNDFRILYMDTTE